MCLKKICYFFYHLFDRSNSTNKWVWKFFIFCFIIYLINFDHADGFQKFLLSSSSSNDGKIFMKVLSLVLYWLKSLFEMNIYIAILLKQDCKVQFFLGKLENPPSPPPQPTRVFNSILHHQTLNPKLKSTHRSVP